MPLQLDVNPLNTFALDASDVLLVPNGASYSVVLCYMSIY